MPRPRRAPTPDRWETQYRSTYTWKSPAPPPPGLGIPEWAYRAPQGGDAVAGVETRRIEDEEEGEGEDEDKEEEIPRSLGGAELSSVGNKNFGILRGSDAVRDSGRLQTPFSDVTHSLGHVPGVTKTARTVTYEDANRSRPTSDPSTNHKAPLSANVLPTTDSRSPSHDSHIVAPNYDFDELHPDIPPSMTLRQHLEAVREAEEAMGKFDSEYRREFRDWGKEEKMWQIEKEKAATRRSELEKAREIQRKRELERIREAEREEEREVVVEGAEERIGERTLERAGKRAGGKAGERAGEREKMKSRDYAFGVWGGEVETNTVRKITVGEEEEEMVRRNETNRRTLSAVEGKKLEQEWEAKNRTKEWEDADIDDLRYYSFVDFRLQEGSHNHTSHLARPRPDLDGSNLRRPPTIPVLDITDPAFFYPITTHHRRSSDDDDLPFTSTDARPHPSTSPSAAYPRSPTPPFTFFPPPTTSTPVPRTPSPPLFSAPLSAPLSASLSAPLFAPLSAPLSARSPLATSPNSSFSRLSSSGLGATAMVRMTPQRRLASEAERREMLGRRIGEMNHEIKKEFVSLRGLEEALGERLGRRRGR